MNQLTDLPDIDIDDIESNSDDHLEAVRQQNETFLGELEVITVRALATGDWDAVYDFLNVARGVTNPPRLRRVSLQEFLETYPCNSTQTTMLEVVDAADELSNPSSDRS